MIVRFAKTDHLAHETDGNRPRIRPHADVHAKVTHAPTLNCLSLSRRRPRAADAATLVSSGIEPCEGSDTSVRLTATRASDAKPSASAARRQGRAVACSAGQPFQTRPLRIETIDWYGRKCYAPGQENAGCSSIQGPRRKLSDIQQHFEPSIPGSRTDPV